MNRTIHKPRAPRLRAVAAATNGHADTPLRLDIGCGKNKQPGFTGVDVRKFDGVDVVADLRKRWPWKDGSVDEIRASHFLEHLDGMERVHFVNELYRVLKPEGKATIICPHWASCRAYGDVTHKWPPVSEMWFYYLSKEWRDLNAPHNDFYRCDFNAVWGWAMHHSLQARAQEFQQNATQFYKEAIQDVHVTLTPKPRTA